MTSKVVSETSFPVTSTKFPTTFTLPPQQPLISTPASSYCPNFVPLAGSTEIVDTSPRLSPSAFHQHPPTSRSLSIPLFGVLECQLPPVNWTNYIQGIEELAALDHNYALGRSKAPLLSQSSSSDSGSRSNDASSTDSTGCSVSSVESKAPIISLVASSSQVQKDQPPKSKQNATKYTGDKKKKEKVVRVKKEKGTPASKSASGNVNTSPKLESLLKAPARKASSKKAAVKAPVQPSFSFESMIDGGEIIDVVTPLPTPKIKYDGVKARNLMNECEKFVNFARPTDVPENWETLIVKTGWTKAQKSLFHQTLKILHKDHLGRLSFAGNPSEPVLRRLLIDSTALHMRSVLTKISWDCKLTQWLHGILKDNLSWEYLASYMDVLQTLRSKVPALVDRMILLSLTAPTTSHQASLPANPGPSSTITQQIVSPIVAQSAEALNLLLKRQWDPFATVVKQTKLKKLKLDPVFIILPCAPSWGNPISSRRTKSILSMLSTVGKSFVVTISQSAVLNASVDEYAEKMIQTSRSRLFETKLTFPDRPIFLIGWGTGAVVAATISVSEKVAGVICLGFPLLTMNGLRGDSSDPFLNLRLPPVLFIVGNKARNNNITEMDKYRKRLKCPSSLVVIKDGDEYLNVKKSQKRLLLVTQSCIDKNIVDEISSFISAFCTDSIMASTLPSTTPYAAKTISPTKILTAPLAHPKPPSPKKVCSPSTSKAAPSILISGSHTKFKDEDKIIAAGDGNKNKKSYLKNESFNREQIFDDVYEFDEAKKIPSNTSSNRRKAYYRSSSTSQSSNSSSVDKTTIPPSANMTASQLVQQANFHDTSTHKTHGSGSLQSPPGSASSVITSAVTRVRSISNSSGEPCTGSWESLQPNILSGGGSVSTSDIPSFNHLNTNFPSTSTLITTVTPATNIDSYTNFNSNNRSEVNPPPLINLDIAPTVAMSTVETTDTSEQRMLSTLNGNGSCSSISSSLGTTITTPSTATTTSDISDNLSSVREPSNNFELVPPPPKILKVSETAGHENENNLNGKTHSPPPPPLISTITTTACGDITATTTTTTSIDSDTCEYSEMTSTKVTRVINSTEIERLNSALLSKCSTDLTKLLASGKSVILKKTLVKKSSSSNGPTTTTNGPLQIQESSRELNNDSSSSSNSNLIHPENSEDKNSSSTSNSNLIHPEDSKDNDSSSSSNSNLIHPENSKDNDSSNTNIAHSSTNSNDCGGYNSYHNSSKNTNKNNSIIQVQNNIISSKEAHNLDSNDKDSTKSTNYKRLRSRTCKVSESEVTPAAPISKDNLKQSSQTQTHSSTNHTNNTNNGKTTLNNLNNSLQHNKEPIENHNNDTTTKPTNYKNLRSRTCKISESDINPTPPNNIKLRKRRASSALDYDNKISSPSTPDGSSLATSKLASKFEVETESNSQIPEEDEEEFDEDDGPGAEKRKHLKKIFPVTPASLSSTRTRKVSIPKFFAFGM